MKDHETLGTHNITDGMTVHLVIRSGNNSANNQQQNNQGQQQTPPVGNPGQTPLLPNPAASTLITANRGPGQYREVSRRRTTKSPEMV